MQKIEVFARLFFQLPIRSTGLAIRLHNKKKDTCLALQMLIFYAFGLKSKQTENTWSTTCNFVLTSFNAKLNHPLPTFFLFLHPINEEQKK